MDSTNKNFEESANINPDGTATHSGWQHFYNAYARYRDDCIRLGRVVLGNNLAAAISSISDYHSSIYTLAQQVFSFYDDNMETNLTEEWINIGNDVNDYLSLVADPQFRKQMDWEGQVSIPIELKTKLLKYFNKVDRMATECGLKVLKEDKTTKEPKKGMMGLG